MRTKRKPHPTQKVTVCVVAQHPLAIELCQRALTKLWGKSPPLQARKASELAADIPSASTYIIDRNEDVKLLAPIILQRYPRARILAIDYAWSDGDAIALLRMGVRGFLTYEQADKQIVRAIQSVGTGGFWVLRTTLSTFVQSILDQTGAPRSTPGLTSDLTHREQQVLPLVCSGQTNKEIAAQLDISPRTAKHYVEELLRKFGVSSRTALIGISAGLPRCKD